MCALEFLGWAQTDYRQAQVYNVNGKNVDFIITDGSKLDGHIYSWENDDNKETFSKGETVTLAMFDFEDDNIYNDIIKYI